MPKVLISDKMSPKAAEVFKANGIEVDVKPGMTPDELKACIGQYDGLAIRSATTATAEIIGAATNLKVVGRAGIGVDNVDIPAATAKGIVVMNTPFGNSVTTAEHAIAMLMSLAREIPAANASTQAGKWEKNRFMGVEVMGKTLGLIGCGNIGSIAADRAQGLKMRVVAYDPFLTPERAKQLHLEKVELDELLKRADFITLHTPLTDGTRNILNKETLAKCKKGVRIVNCARGGLVDEAALRDAILSGHVAGAAFDVFSQEPAKENPLFGLDQVICTPHLGASTSEAQENVAVQVAEQISAYLNEGTVTNAVNMPSVSAEEAASLKPYLTLAGQLGGFAGQLTQTGLKAVEIVLEGKAAKLNSKPLVAVALQGLLSPLVEDVNMVNAPAIAQDRGIKVSETKRDDAGDYPSRITVSVTTEQQTRSISGTVFASDKPRIINVNGVQLEASVGPNMLFVNNEDKPGLIGNLGKVLGEAGINIANFHLGRNEARNDAIALLELDQKLDKATLDKVAKLPSVKQAVLLKF